MKGIIEMKMEERKMMTGEEIFPYVQNYVIMAFEKDCPSQILLRN